MKKKKYDESEGVWRTIGGRRVFIRKGQSLSEAMKDSGKFKKTSDVSRNEYQDRKAELKRDNLREKWHEADLKAHKEDLKFMKDKINYEGNRLELGEKAHNLKEDYEFAKDIVKDRIDSEIYQRNYNKDGSTKTIEETREYLNSKKEKTKKTPYNSKAYAKSLSKSYNAEEEYEDKITPKYIQDIDSARYGNMSDEEAIKTWIDGGADIIYNDDAEKQLKEWGIPVRNDDAYGTYKSELAKQLLPIYRSDKYKTSLMKKPLGDLRDMAEDYNINIKGLSRNEIIEKLLAIYNKNK